MHILLESGFVKQNVEQSLSQPPPHIRCTIRDKRTFFLSQLSLQTVLVVLFHSLVAKSCASRQSSHVLNFTLMITITNAGLKRIGRV